MDFLLDALNEIAGEIFNSVAHPLNLDLDIVFVDSTSSYWQVDGADELVDLAEDALAVTRDGIPVRCWTFPGNTGDQLIIRRIKDDLAGRNLHRLIWVADRGFASAVNRAYLTRGGGHYIHAEKLRNTNAEAADALARSGC